MIGIMNKYFPFVLSLLFIWMIMPLPVAASQSMWQLDMRDDGGITEKISIKEQDDPSANQEWNSSKEEGTIILDREVKDWQAYQALAQRLPVKAQVKNYILFKTTTMTIQDERTAVDFLNRIAASGDGKLVIRVPGVIGDNTADEVKEMAASWDLHRLAQMDEGQKLLEATTLDGFMIGVVLFGTGFLVVMIVFMSNMSRVNRLISDKYSLENLEAEDRNSEKDEDEWK